MTLPEIANFVREYDIEFLGFVADPGITRQFRTRFPQPDAESDLDRWQDFETESRRLCRDVPILGPQERIAPGRPSPSDRCRAIFLLDQPLDRMRMLHSCGAAKFLLQCSMTSYFPGRSKVARVSEARTRANVFT